MADQLGGLLDPYSITLSFVRFLLLDTFALAQLPSTHHWQRAEVLVCCDLTSVASTGPIFKCHELLIL
jgi:hypothetical protein